MSEYYDKTNDIAVSFGEIEGADAEVRAYQYPDGMVKNSLSPDELREVAQMLEQAADELEERR